MLNDKELISQYKNEQKEYLIRKVYKTISIWHDHSSSFSSIIFHQSTNNFKIYPVIE